jgi:O-antigen/teichoic acid export membrane protein
VSSELEHHSRGVARDAALGIAGRGVAMVASSVTAIVVAATLVKAEYGAYAIIFGLQVILVMALDLGLTSSLARYVAQGRATTRLVITVAAARLGIIGAAALLVLSAPSVVPAVDRSTLAPLLPALAALVVAQSLITFQFGVLPSLRRIRLLLLVTVAQPLVELALVLRVASSGGGAEEMILATTYAGLGVSVLAWVLLLAPGRAASPDVPDAGAAEHATFGMVAKYGRQIFLVSLLIAVFGQIDQLIIGLFHPLTDVAPYALAIKVQALIAAPAITIAGIVAPRIAGAGVAAQAMYRQWLAFLIVLTCGAVLTVAVLSAELFGAIDPRYRGDSMLLVAMAPVLLLAAVAPLPSIALNQTGLAASRLRIAAITVAINVALDLALVPSLGAWGAVIATTIAFSYYFARHHGLLERALGEVAAPPAPSIRGVLVRGGVMSVAVAALAVLVRVGLEAALDDPSDVLVLLGAGGIAAVIHVAYSVRIVRRPVA